MASKPRVLLTEPVFEDVINLLEEHTNLTIGKRGQFNYETPLAEIIGEFDGLLSMLSNPVTEAVISKAKKLKVIANYAVGYNNIDITAATQNGILVANTPDVLTETTAEGTFALILATARRLNEAETALRNGEFDGWHPTGFLGIDLAGKKLGIIGMGRIGTELARRARAFGMQILYHNRNRAAQEIESELGAIYFDDLDEIMKQADILSLNCPLTTETHHLINERTLGLMNKESILINATRGAVVDEAALANALHSKSIRAAGLDVFEFEPKIHPDLLTAPNAVLLPHITSATTATRKAMGMLAAGAILKTLCDLDMKCHFVNQTL